MSPMRPSWGELYANLAKEAFKPYEALSRKGSLIAAPARNAFIDHTLRRQHGLEVRARTG
jgi:hypothetical protein